MIKYPLYKKNAQRPNTHAYPAPRPHRASHKYYYAFIILLDHRNSNLGLAGHIRMVVEIMIITYYVIAIPLGIWALR